MPTNDGFVILNHDDGSGVGRPSFRMDPAMARALGVVLFEAAAAAVDIRADLRKTEDDAARRLAEEIRTGEVCQCAFCVRLRTMERARRGSR